MIKYSEKQLHWAFQTMSHQEYPCLLKVCSGHNLQRIEMKIYMVCK